MIKSLWKSFENYKYAGIVMAISIISLWLISLSLLLTQFTVSFTNPLTYIFIILMTHLYTGLFITAHDSMHATISENKKLNYWLGRISTILFVFNSYKKLYPKHHEHHRFVGSSNDPDYYNGSFFPWFLKFVREYISIWQILLIALTFQILQYFFNIQNVICFYIIPSVLSTLQLFYFGTYLPHRGSLNNKHKSSSQKKNHFIAFISCYFFGYHYEHHDSPGTPWWKLYKVKEAIGENKS